VAPTPRAATVVPPTVVALGFVSLCMDLSSEIVHALLPLFLTTTLGASVALVGMIDGIAEATASFSKLFSGYLSDRIGRRKPLIVFGYSLAAATRPLFALANSAGMVLGARFLDRIGKGLRDAPRDALIADVALEGVRGRSFGLRQALDTVGAFAGPMLAVGLMQWFDNDMRSVFWVAGIPALFAVATLLFFVRDPGRRAAAAPGEPARLRPAELKRLPRGFWFVTSIGAMFTLARFSEGFLVLRAHDVGLSVALAPLVFVAMNIVYACGAYPAGILADRVNPGRLLLAGLLLLIAADLLLAFAESLPVTFAGIALWGAHMAATQGLFAKMVADRSPERLRGSAFGVYNLANGLSLLLASLFAGLLWDRIGPAATFLGGAALALATMLLVVTGGLWRRASRER